MPLRTLIILTFSFTLTACSSFEFPWVYKISVQQGNIIEQKDVDKLEIGMTKRQVQFVMGSPLLIDTFDQDRWDYYYRMRTGAGKVRSKQFTVFFEDDLFVRYAGDVQPTPEGETAKEDTVTEEIKTLNDVTDVTEDNSDKTQF